MIEQRRLTSAVATHKRNHFTRSELEIDSTKRGDRTIRSLKTVGCRDDVPKRSDFATENCSVDRCELIAKWASDSPCISNRKWKWRPTGETAKFNHWRGHN
jgi:hypothetical protein